MGKGAGVRRFLGQLWLLLAAFGICFALLSALEEAARGDYLKALAAVALGLVVYAAVGRPRQE